MNVNQPLTRKRAKRDVSTEDYAAFAARMLRAYGRRVADGDIMDLQDLFEFREAVEEVVTAAVIDMKANGSYSWAEIGKAAGMTRQAAQQKYGRSSSVTTPAPSSASRKDV